MATTYLLDLTKEEYRDDYCLGEKGELWQLESKNSLIRNLELSLNDAIKYGEFRQSGDSLTWLSHNSILISSPRGSGKTIFLRNAGAIWKKEKSNSDLYFLDTIDPTMLLQNDSFANVIVAQIYQKVSEIIDTEFHLNKKVRDLSEKFHLSLRKLANSMGKSEEFNGSIGIDKILNYSSGIQVESNFHLFVENAIQILNCKAIVVAIDDVDMALERAFEVVDDVRRFLGCPYIIPIVSGDLKLYEHMTNVHFDQKVYDVRTNDKKLTQDAFEISRELTEAYLTKVFPSSMRISLTPIEKIIPKLEIVSERGRERFNSLHEKVLNKLNFICHNRDSRRAWPTPDSARELSQFVRLFSPESIKESENTELLLKLKNWATLKKNGKFYSIADSALHCQNGEYSDIRSLICFNIIEQLDCKLFPWANYDFLNSQIRDLRIHFDNGVTYQQNLKLIESAFELESKSLLPMPPLEFIINEFFISSEKSKTEKISKLTIPSDLLGILNEKSLIDSESSEIEYSVSGLLLDIYTESNLYSTLGNNKKFIFISRAFEIIVFSLLSKGDFGNVYSSLYKILRRQPFYSVVSIADTKVAIEGQDEEAEMLNDLTIINSVLVLSIHISAWRDKHSNLFDSDKGRNLIPLISYCFNSVFTSFNIIKNNVVNNKKSYDEHLTDVVLRFKYNLLNSIIRSGIFGEAIYANVLVNAKPTNFRNINDLQSFERVYQRNKKLLEEECEYFQEDIEKFESIKYCIELHDALIKHPVFELFEGIDLLPIGSKQNDSAKEDNKKHETVIDSRKKPSIDSIISFDSELLEEIRDELLTIISDEACLKLEYLYSNVIPKNAKHQSTIQKYLHQSLNDTEKSKRVLESIALISKDLEEHDYSDLDLLLTKDKNVLTVIKNWNL